MDFTKGIKQGGKVIYSLVLLGGSVFLLLMIYLLVVGSVNNVAQTNDIGITNDTLTNLNTTETAFDTTVVDNSTSNLGTVFGFVALAVIMAIFGWLIWGRRNNGGGGVMS